MFNKIREYFTKDNSVVKYSAGRKNIDSVKIYYVCHPAEKILNSFDPHIKIDVWREGTAIAETCYMGINLAFWDTQTIIFECGEFKIMQSIVSLYFAKYPEKQNVNSISEIIKLDSLISKINQTQP